MSVKCVVRETLFSNYGSGTIAGVGGEGVAVKERADGFLDSDAGDLHLEDVPKVPRIGGWRSRFEVRFITAIGKVAGG